MTISEQLAQIQTIPPKGSITFTDIENNLYQAPPEGTELFYLVRGRSALRMVQTQDLSVVFYYATPGVGTLAASLKLPPSEPSRRVSIHATWTHAEAWLGIIWHTDTGEEICRVSGSPCVPDHQLVVDETGNLTFLGSKGVEVRGVQVWVDDRELLMPRALEYWNRTLRVCDTLTSQLTSKDAAMEFAICNAAISALVTGFEVYVRIRLVEMEHEGLTPDLDRFFRKQLRAELQDDTIQRFRDEAAKSGETVLQCFIRVRRMSAQSYDRAKDLFNALYGLSLARLGISDEHVARAKICVEHRHFLTHQDPMAPIVFAPKTRTPIGPVTTGVVQGMREALDTIIRTIHQATLEAVAAK